jgi:integrase
MATKDTRSWRAVKETKQFGATNRNIFERVRVRDDGKVERVGSGRRSAASPYKVILTHKGRRYERAAPTLAAARRERETMEEKLGKGVDPTEQPILLADYADQWIETYEGKRGDLREETKLEYKTELDLAKHRFAGRTLASITSDDAKAYVKHVRETRGREKRDAKGHVVKREPAKASTIRNAVAPLRAMFFSAMASSKTTQVESNPFSRLGIADKRTEVKATDRAAVAALEDQVAKAKFFTIPQLQRVLEELSKPPERPDGVAPRKPWPDGYWALFGEFLVQTGLRISEAAALQWQHIDFKKGHVKVRRRLYRSPDKNGKRVATVGATKSRYSERDVPLSPGMVKKLEALRASRGSVGKNDPVFSSQTGGFLNPTNVFNRHFKPALRRAGVGWAGFHTFRHTAASLLFMESHRSNGGTNASVLAVSSFLGHHSGAYTLNTYLHILGDGETPDLSFFDQITNGTKNGTSRTAKNPANKATSRSAKKASQAGESAAAAKRSKTRKTPAGDF